MQRSPQSFCKKIDQVLKDHHVKALYLFGSIVRGDE